MLASFRVTRFLSCVGCVANNNAFDSTTAYAPLFYPRVEEVVPHRSDEGATYELQPTGKLSTWLSPTEDDQHLLLRRHEIVTCVSCNVSS